MMKTSTAAVAAVLLGAAFLLGKGDAVVAQDFDRDRERLRECDPASQDCDLLRQQIMDRLRDQLRDCDQGCDQLRAQLREVEQLSQHDRDRERDADSDGGGRDGGGAGSGGGGGGGSGGGGGGGRN